MELPRHRFSPGEPALDFAFRQSLRERMRIERLNRLLPGFAVVVSRLTVMGFVELIVPINQREQRARQPLLHFPINR